MSACRAKLRGVCMGGAWGSHCSLGPRHRSVCLTHSGPYSSHSGAQGRVFHRWSIYLAPPTREKVRVLFRLWDDTGDTGTAAAEIMGLTQPEPPVPVSNTIILS
ncbi:hypothetical protein NHX12_021241 [Muraenolepis orangiensis]|uniref:Uncharacterized protein n=1 Tax=Muraenolepis orangiensis TaxID=630683 RepID=A0A9Q0ETC5_9TELE|nr:hypothetical protein NHX12_021241 [Muraenolepis orangiensis]